MVEGSGEFQVLAHVDFIGRYLPARRRARTTTAAYEEEYRTIFRALARSGRALELNTKSGTDLRRPAAVVVRRGRRGGLVRQRRARAGRGRAAASPTAAAMVEAAGFRPGRHPYDWWRR